MNLYQHQELARFESYIDAETGEVNIEAFNNAQIALRDKQEAVVCYLKNEGARIDLLDGAIKELQARKKAMELRHDNLKQYLIVNMQQNRITEISANNSTFVAKLRNNPPKLIIDDAGKIPANLYVYPVAPKPYPDNAAIKEMLKSGEIIEGAHLESGVSLIIK
jgi:hypothetical protein